MIITITAHTAQQQQQTNNPIKQEAEDLSGRLSKEDMLTANGHANGLNTANYQRSANQIYSGVSPHTGQNGHHQKAYK